MCEWEQANKRLGKSEKNFLVNWVLVLLERQEMRNTLHSFLKHDIFYIASKNVLRVNTLHNILITEAFDKRRVFNHMK